MSINETFRRFSGASYYKETVENFGTSAADMVQVVGVIGLMLLALSLLGLVVKKEQTSNSS